MQFDDAALEITADRFEYHAEREVYTAEGQVRIVQGERTLVADWVSFSARTRRGVASGNVELREDDDVFRARFVEFDLDTLEGVLFDADLDTGAEGFQIQAKRLDRIDHDRFAVEGAVMTTCRCKEGERIPWRLRIGEGEVELGGYAVTRNTTLEILGVPAIWLPWMLFPVKTERETGLLFPEFGIGSTNGFEVGLPIFWAPRQDLNVLFTPRYLTKRGFKPDLEIEYAPRSDLRGTLYGSFIHDRKVAKASGKDYGPNRWAALWQHDQILPGKIHFRSDVKLVSDNEYAHDFDDMSRYRNDRYLESSAYAVRHFGSDGRFGAVGSVLWADDLQTPDDQDRDAFLMQRLPRVDFDSLAGGNPWLEGLVTSFESDYTYFFSERRAQGVLNAPAGEVFTGFLDTGVDASPNFREPGYDALLNPDPNRDDWASFRGPEGNGVLDDGEPLTDRGSRVVLHPRVAYPLRFFDALEVYPEVGYYQTLYFTEEQDFAQRGLATARLDLRTRLRGTLAVPGMGDLTHLIEPRLNWTYVQKQDQDDNPVFVPATSVPQDFLRQLDTESIVLDPADRIPEANLVTLGAVQRFYTQGASRELVADIAFEAGYDLARGRFALINFDGRALPRKGLRARFNLSIDPEKGEIAQGRIDLSTRLPKRGWFKGGTLGFGYRYRREVPLFFSGRNTARYDDQRPISQIDAFTQLRLGPRWTLQYSMNVSLEEGELLRNAGGLTYTSGCDCWRIGVGVRQDRDRKVQFDFLITLLGVGDGLGFGAGGLAPGADSGDFDARY